MNQDRSCKASPSPYCTVCLGLPEIGKKHNYLGRGNFHVLMKSFEVGQFLYISLILRLQIPFFKWPSSGSGPKSRETLDTLSHHFMTTLPSSGTQAASRVLKWSIPQVHVPFPPAPKKIDPIANQPWPAALTAKPICYRQTVLSAWFGCLKEGEITSKSGSFSILYFQSIILKDQWF